MPKPIKQPQLVITCETCGKQILPEPGHVHPTKYCIFNCHNVCWDCVKAGKTSQFKLIK